jgi:hypothetical protein
MTDYDIHSCGYYCYHPACIKRQRDELRDKLFSDQAVKTYSGGKPNYTRPIEKEWVGLTEEERSDLVTLHHGWNEYGQAIEAKLKEKNNG